MAKKKRRFNDNADFDQAQARASDLLRRTDSFILFHFDNVEERTEVVSAVAFNDMPYALDALETQKRTLLQRALIALLERTDESD